MSEGLCKYPGLFLQFFTMVIKLWEVVFWLFFWVMGIFRQASDEVLLHSCEQTERTMKYGFIPVRYSGSGTGSDSSSWHWTSVGTDATTMPSGSCCSMPRAKFFCLVIREMRKWEVPFKDRSTQSSNKGRGEKWAVRVQVGCVKRSQGAHRWLM